MAASTGSARAWLEDLIELAPKLRAAGVLKVEVGGMCAEMLPSVPEVPKGTLDEFDTEMDPLNDPDTYGGGDVPGFPMERLEALREKRRQQ